MWLNRITLRNVGVHERLDVRFQRGLVAVCGPNGSGKSTLVKAALAALTNDWSRFHGGKEAALRDTTGDGGEAHVRLEAEHAGCSFVVTRRLRGSPAHELSVPAEGLELFKDGEIGAFLESRLGVDRKTINTYVFVRQRGMLDFLDQGEAARAKAFHHLCRTGRAVEIFDAAGRMLSGLAAAAEPVEAADALRVRLGEARARRKRLRAELEHWGARVLSGDVLRQARRAVAAAEALEVAGVDLAAAEARITNARDDVVSATDQVERARAARREASDRVEAGRSAAAAAARRVALQDRRESVGRDLRRAATALRQLQAEAVNRPEPPPPAGRVSDLDAARARLLADQSRLRGAREDVRTFAASGVVACPTCGTPVSQFYERVEESRRLVRDLPPTITDQFAAIAAEEAYRRELSGWREWEGAHAARRLAAQREVDRIEEELAGLPAGDAERDREAVEAHRRLEEALRGADDRLLMATERLDARSKAVARAEADLVERTARVAALQVDARKAAKARRYLLEHEEAVPEVAAREATLGELGATIDDLGARLEAAREDADRERRRAAAAGLLGRLRDEVFHHSRLPRLVARGNLQRTEGAINRELELFGRPFRVEAGDDLGFVVHFPGDPPRRAEQLSDGQKGVLAFAYRPALASVFDADVGLLVLDEPTDGLDGANLIYLREALRRLAGEVRGKRQLIVVTHQESLLPAFDQVVRIGESSDGERDV